MARQIISAEEWAETVRVLQRAGSDVEIVVESVHSEGLRRWGIVALVQGDDRLILGRPREFRRERKLWRRFDWVVQYLEKELPMLIEVRVRLKDAKGSR